VNWEDHLKRRFPTRSFLTVPELTKQVRTLMSFTSLMMRRYDRAQYGRPPDWLGLAMRGGLPWCRN
jgi:hypothetical protein